MSIEDCLYSKDGMGTGIVGLVDPRSDTVVQLVAVLPVGMDDYYNSILKQLRQTEVTLVPVVAGRQKSFWKRAWDRFNPMARVSGYDYFCSKVAMDISLKIRASGISNPPRIATVFDKIYGDGSLSRENPDMPTDIIPVPVRAQNDLIGISSLADLLAGLTYNWKLKRNMGNGANYETFIKSLKLREEIAARPSAYRIGEEILWRLRNLEQGIKSVAIASSPWHMPYIQQRLQSEGFKRIGKPEYMQALPPIPENRGANSYMTNSLPAPYSRPARPAFVRV